MPFVSKAQNAWAHTPEGVKALGSKLDEWEQATPDVSSLPQKVTPQKVKNSIVKKVTKSQLKKLSSKL